MEPFQEEPLEEEDWHNFKKWRLYLKIRIQTRKHNIEECEKKLKEDPTDVWTSRYMSILRQGQALFEKDLMEHEALGPPPKKKAKGNPDDATEDTVDAITTSEEEPDYANLPEWHEAVAAELKQKKKRKKIRRSGLLKDEEATKPCQQCGVDSQSHEEELVEDSQRHELVEDSQCHELVEDSQHHEELVEDPQRHELVEDSQHHEELVEDSQRHERVEDSQQQDTLLESSGEQVIEDWQRPCWCVLPRVPGPW